MDTTDSVYAFFDFLQPSYMCMQSAVCVYAVIVYVFLFNFFLGGVFLLFLSSCLNTCKANRRCLFNGIKPPCLMELLLKPSLSFPHPFLINYRNMLNWYYFYCI